MVRRPPHHRDRRVGGRLPIMDEVIAEAEHRGVALTATPTRDACRLLREMPRAQVFAILHVTC